MLYGYEVAVAHQKEVFAVYAYNAMHYVFAVVYPCQNHIANLCLCRLLQNNAVALAHNKRQHTPPRYGQRNCNAFVYQSDCFFYDIVTSHYAL